MPLLSLLKRILWLAVSIALPFAALGYLAGHLRGVVIAEGFALTLALAAAIRAEKAFLRIYRVKPEPPASVQRSLDRVLAAMGGRGPKVFSFSDPAPQALISKGLGSRGSILLSEGLLGTLSEAELREILRASVLRLRSRGASFQTLCAWLTHLAFELAPQSWVGLLFGELRWHEGLGALGALRFLAVFSVARFFVDLGRSTGQGDAPRGLTRLPPVAGEVTNPGSCILHFSDPWANRSLVPLLRS